MEKGDFQLAVRDFDPTMLKLSGPEKLEPMWTKQLPAQIGAFKKQAGARREQLQGYEIVLVTCEFEKATLDARVVFDKAGKIAGLQFVPPAPPAKYEPPAYADPAKFEETEVTVGSGEWALPGTLTMPKGAGPFPGSRPRPRLGPERPGRGRSVPTSRSRTWPGGWRRAASPSFVTTSAAKSTARGSWPTPSSKRR